MCRRTWVPCSRSSGSTVRYFRAFIEQVEVFNLWSLGLMVLGLQTLCGCSRVKASGIILCYWAVIVVISAKYLL